MSKVQKTPLKAAKNTTKRAKSRALVRLVLCYAMVLLVYGIVCTVGLVRDEVRKSNGTMQPMAMAAESFTYYENVLLMESAEGEAGWRFAGRNTDPMFVLKAPAGMPAGRMVFSAEPLNGGAGEMVLYYTTRPDEDFSEKNKLWAQKTADGWEFDLGGRTVYDIRWDPDNRGRVIWRVDGITLNAEKAWWRYFMPSPPLAAALLLVPPLLWGVWGEVAAFLQPIFTRRRLERHWSGRGKPAGERNGAPNAQKAKDDRAKDKT